MTSTPPQERGSDSPDPNDDAIERGRALFAAPCVFFHGTPSVESLPTEVRPEAAFAGRSNVGKSSLLNALIGRRSLARFGGTPGCTQQLNFFDLGGRLTLVDMPGYGYARAPQSHRRRWTALTRDYLRGRRALKRLCLLVDARRGLGDSDAVLMDMLDEAGVVYQVVLTKVDQIPPSWETVVLEQTRRSIARRAAAFPEVVATSAGRGDGMPQLRATLAALAMERASG